MSSGGRTSINLQTFVVPVPRVRAMRCDLRHMVIFLTHLHVATQHRESPANHHNTTHGVSSFHQSCVWNHAQTLTSVPLRSARRYHKPQFAASDLHSMQEKFLMPVHSPAQDFTTNGANAFFSYWTLEIGHVLRATIKPVRKTFFCSSPRLRSGLSPVTLLFARALL
jgi:hypothetical protein